MSIARTETQEIAPGKGREKTRRWQRVVLPLLRAMARRAQQMPRAKATRFAERLGAFLYSLSNVAFKRPHKYARRNLRLTQFPEPNMSEKAQDAFIRRVFIHFSKSLIDFLRGPTLTPEEVERLVHAEGAEHL